MPKTAFGAQCSLSATASVCGPLSASHGDIPDCCMRGCAISNSQLELQSDPSIDFRLWTVCTKPECSAWRHLDANDLRLASVMRYGSSRQPTALTCTGKCIWVAPPDAWDPHAVCIQNLIQGLPTSAAPTHLGQTKVAAGCSHGPAAKLLVCERGEDRCLRGQPPNSPLEGSARRGR